MSTLLTPKTPLKVSSTLDRANQRKNMLDRSNETCWASASGSPQWVVVQLPRRARVDWINITFQGGFAGTEVTISCSSPPPPSIATDQDDYTSPPPAPQSTEPWSKLTTFYPQDTNVKQSFVLGDNGVGVEMQNVRLEFTKSSDFFGRIVVYELDMVGEWVDGIEPAAS